MVTGRTQKLPKEFKRLSKPMDMTIHRKALEEHFPMAPFVFVFNHFWGKMHFLNFSQMKWSKDYVLTWCLIFYVDFTDLLTIIEFT
jgi:hypothetical protein